MSLPAKYTTIVDTAAVMAGAVGIPGSAFPPLDIAVMSVIWVKMTRDIATASGHTIDGKFATKLVYAIGAGSLLYIGGSKLANALLHLIPGAGTVAAAGTNAAFNYVYTNRLGAMLATQFDRADLDTDSVLSMAKNMAAAVFVNVSADEIAAAQDALTSADDAAAESAPEQSEAPADPIVSTAGQSSAVHDPRPEPKFGYTAPGVTYLRTSDMVAGKGWDASNKPVDASGYPR